MPSSGTRVITFTTPPIAPDPYKVEAAPLTTSTRSIPSIFFKIVNGTLTPAAFILIPSTIYKTLLLPLILKELELVYPTPPPYVLNSTPGTLRKASPKLDSCLSSKSSPFTTVTLAGTLVTCCSVLVAVTTTSGNAYTSSVVPAAAMVWPLNDIPISANVT